MLHKLSFNEKIFSNAKSMERRLCSFSPSCMSCVTQVTVEKESLHTTETVGHWIPRAPIATWLCPFSLLRGDVLNIMSIQHIRELL